MALTNLLYVKSAGAPLATAGVRAITINEGYSVLEATGDNALTSYAGRKDFVTGTIALESLVTALSRVGAAATASQTFVCASAITNAPNNTTVTVSNFRIEGFTADLSDGLTSGPIAAATCTWIGTDVS